jgi:lipopolysaccharide export system protein LptA
MNPAFASTRNPASLRAIRRIRRQSGAVVLGVLLAVAAGGMSSPAAAQALNLSKGGPISITSQGGIEWRQLQQEVIADQSAKAVRGNVTITSDQLIAHYRKKPAAPGQKPAAAPAAPAAPAGLAGDGSEGGTEIYLLEARGTVHIYTPTDQAFGDHAAYDMDQAVLVLTGAHLKLATADYVVTSRDSLEYWSSQHMAVARGNAVVVTKDGRRIAGDVLVAYTDTTPAPGQAGAPAGNAAAQNAADPIDPSGKLKRVDAIGHVVIQTATDIVQGDRGVYVPSIGIARLAGNVHITRGQNELMGAEALVNMKTGVSRLLAHPGARVEGLIMPNQAAQATTTAPAPAKRPKVHPAP